MKAVGMIVLCGHWSRVFVVAIATEDRGGATVLLLVFVARRGWFVVSRRLWQACLPFRSKGGRCVL